ncbi:MAG: CidA/LrgA family protein [Rikenellaceae bacterium]
MSRELKGIAIILGVYLVGEILSRLIGGFMPGSILGMILLFVLLQYGVVAEEDIKGVCNFMLSNMMLLFVPVTVGIMVNYTLIAEDWIAISLCVVASTAIVIIIVGLLQQTLSRLWKK